MADLLVPQESRSGLRKRKSRRASNLSVGALRMLGEELRSVHFVLEPRLTDCESSIYPCVVRGWYFLLFPRSDEFTGDR